MIKTTFDGIRTAFDGELERQTQGFANGFEENKQFKTLSLIEVPQSIDSNITQDINITAELYKN